MNATERGKYTWIISRGTHQLQRMWSTGPLPGVKHTDNVCTSLIQEVLQWRGTPNSSTWTAMGSTGEEDPTCPARDMSTDTWSSTLMGRTTRCSPSTDGSCKTWEDLGEDSTKPSTNTMTDIHVAGSHTLQNKVGFQFHIKTVPAKLHHLSFIFDFVSRKSKAARLYISPNFYPLIRHLPTKHYKALCQFKTWNIVLGE